jgi:hypothetical protein
MDVQAIGLGHELGEAVQPGLRRRPVIALQPVTAQVADVGQGCPLGPVTDGLALRRPRPAQPLPQVVQLGLGHLNQERPDKLLLLAGRR